MTVSSIEWTDRTWNPVRGCSRVSEGCRNCYAESFAARNLPGMRSPTTGKPFAVRTSGGPRWTGDVELIQSKLDEPLHWKKPQRVFVNSMSDLFHEALPFKDIARVIDRMAWGLRLVCKKGDGCDCDCQHDTDCLDLTDPCRCWAEVTQHTYQVLTKRPQRMLDFFRWLDERAPDSERSNGDIHAPTLMFCRDEIDWPLPNVWLGVSVEDQATADERIPYLLETPAAIRFVSYEPALAPVDFKPRPHRNVCLQCGEPKTTHPLVGGHPYRGRGLDWIIYGGESGPGARPNDIAWARSTRDQCKAAGVPVFVKQLGARPTCAPDERQGTEVGLDAATKRWTLEAGRSVLLLKNRKGGDPAEWPEDLRVREFPA